MYMRIILLKVPLMSVQSTAGMNLKLSYLKAPECSNSMAYNNGTNGVYLVTFLLRYISGTARAYVPFHACTSK